MKQKTRAKISFGLVVFGLIILVIGLNLLFEPLIKPAYIIKEVEDPKSEAVFSLNNQGFSTKQANESVGFISKVLFSGKVFFSSGIKEQIVNWRENYVDKNKEWGICLYGYSYELQQDYVGYFVEKVTFGENLEASANQSVFDCTLYLDDSSYVLIGDAHSHVDVSVMPSFQDTLSWNKLSPEYLDDDAHCIFNNKFDMACFSGDVRPVDFVFNRKI